MKHLQIYEKYKRGRSPKYQKGDYVVTITGKTRVIRIRDAWAIKYWLDEDDTWVSEQFILRKATPKEIEEYQIKKDAGKYNL